MTALPAARAGGTTPVVAPSAAVAQMIASRRRERVMATPSLGGSSLEDHRGRPRQRRRRPQQRGRSVVDGGGRGAETRRREQSIDLIAGDRSRTEQPEAVPPSAQG